MSDEIKSPESESESPKRDPESGETSGSDTRSLSEQALDALDAAPASRRRSAIILGMAGALFVFCLVVLILMPPLSWKSEKKVQSNYRIETELTQLEAGGGEKVELRYAPVTDRTVYGLKVHQKVEYGQGVVSEVQIETDVVWVRPQRRETDDAVMITLENVHVKVLDGADEVKLASIGGMLADVGVYSRLGAQEGLYTVVPEANVNPQVARVLLVVSDVIRQFWQPLPKEGVGAGAHWTYRDISGPKMPYYREASVTMKPRGDGYGLESHVELKGVEKALSGEGDGEIVLRDGRISEGRLSYRMDGGTRRLTVDAGVVTK